MNTSRLPTRRLRFFLRDFRVIEAEAGFAEGQTLATYFGHRRTYVNLRAAEWTGTRERIAHAMVRVDQLLWVVALEGGVPLSSASGAQRLVEMQLDGGMRLRGRLLLGAHQRVSDVLESSGAFIPIAAAELLKSGRAAKEVNVELGDVVLNQAAIQAVWELEAPPTRKRAARTAFDLRAQELDEL
jgi:hypothetical protein